MRGFGRGKYVDQGGLGCGPGGDCVCTQCGYRTPHTRDDPCFRRRCPRCGMVMR